jgi:putative transposase
MSHQRETIISLIADAQANGARQKTACGIVDILPKTLQRWVRAESLRDGRLEPIHTPVNKLTDLERQRILTICNEKQYSRLPHSKIVPILAYKGV